VQPLPLSVESHQNLVVDKVLDKTPRINVPLSAQVRVSIVG
jgi:hypothetical protein